MFVQKVKRVVNPHRVKRRKATKRVARAANGRFLKKTKRRAKKSSSRRNPAQLLTLGFANPHKARRRRKNSAMATKHRKSPKRSAAARKAARTRKRNLLAKSNPVRRRRRARRSVARRANPIRRRRSVGVARHRRRRNSTRVIVMAPKRRNGGRRRNPMLFGQHVSPGQAAKMVAAGLVGVTATKLIVPMIPGGLTATPIGAMVASIAVALAGGWLIGKWDTSVGNAFAFGGFMQAGSILLNMVPVPGVSQFALSGYRGGVGDFVPASFPIPQTPILLTGNSVGRGGAAGSRAYPSAYRR